jgi:hypothetical protein
VVQAAGREDPEVLAADREDPEDLAADQAAREDPVVLAADQAAREDPVVLAADQAARVVVGEVRAAAEWGRSPARSCRLSFRRLCK